MGAQAVRLSNVDIDNALKNRDFEVLFQPIFDLGNGALARVETFVRWRHASLGVLPPGAFISFFESQGRMSELTRYVLSQALGEYRDWRGSSAPGFSINLALSDLSDDAFASHFDVLLRDAGFPADLITLECPMPPVTMEVAQAAEQFARLARTGARLAIEVRGRANDFLRQIEPFPFDEIKTGGAAILRFARTVRGPGLSAISELLEIANAANAAITAVGVEDQASLSALRGLGFAAAQGNHLGKVGPLSSFTSARVNEVRTLLGLEPLSADDLASLFRTEAPAPRPADPASSPIAPAPIPAVEDDVLVERLAARLARQPAAGAPVAVEKEAPRGVLKTAAAKAAAIARARKKAAAKEAEPVADAAPPALASSGIGSARGASSAGEATPARSLQERLSRAFDADGLEDIPETDEELTFGSLLDEEEEDISRTGNESADERAPGALRPGPALVASVRERAGETPPSADLPSADLPGANPSTDDPAAEKTPAETPRSAAGGPRHASPAASFDPDAEIQTGLSIKGARAYFRPGLRVSAMRPLTLPPDEPLLIDDHQPPPRPQVAPPRPQTASAPAPEPVPEGQGEDPPLTGADPAPAARAKGRQQPRRRKSFLMRTVLPYPTHFWPHSWKRAWRRRADDRVRRRAENEQIAAE